MATKSVFMRNLESLTEGRGDQFMKMHYFTFASKPGWEGDQYQP